MVQDWVGHADATIATGGTKNSMNRYGSVKIPIACRIDARAMPDPQIINGPRNSAAGAIIQNTIRSTIGDWGIMPPSRFCRIGATYFAAAWKIFTPYNIPIRIPESSTPTYRVFCTFSTSME